MPRLRWNWVGEMRVRPISAWYDLWVGLFIDRPRLRAYIFPILRFGFVIGWAKCSTYYFEEMAEL